MDSSAINDSCGILSLLNEGQFCCLDAFFLTLLLDVDILYKTLKMRNIGITGAYCKNLKIKKKSISAYLEQANELAGLYKKKTIMSTSAKAKEVTQTDII